MTPKIQNLIDRCSATPGTVTGGYMDLPAFNPEMFADKIIQECLCLVLEYNHDDTESHRILLRRIAGIKDTKDMQHPWEKRASE